jgi:hypothetical protein
VNHTTSQVDARPNVSAIAVVVTASTSSVANGHA